MFKTNNLKTILRKVKGKRLWELKDNLDNILFLDYDGVISLDFSLETLRPVFAENCIDNVNRLCKEFNLKIVVTSSWRDQDDCIDMLYANGLDKEIEVIGKTTDMYGSREKEIEKYLEEHIYIDKFIILDDSPFDELSDYHIRTLFTEGFDDEKYEDAVQLLKMQKGNG